MKFNSKKIDISKYIVYIIFVLCLIIFGIWLKGSFFSLSNLLNITRQAGGCSFCNGNRYGFCNWLRSY